VEIDSYMENITSEVIYRTFFGTSGKDKLIDNKPAVKEILEIVTES
jgi:hypothetical protein